jgi:hypothetical protein
MQIIITLPILGLAGVVIGNFAMGAVIGYLCTCLVSSAQADHKVVKTLAFVGLTGIALGAALAVPYKEKPKPTTN